MLPEAQTPVLVTSLCTEDEKTLKVDNNLGYLPECTELLATGSFGTVWLGLGKKGEKYAVKIFGPNKQESFENELKVFRSHPKMQQHPNIIQLIDTQEQQLNRLSNWWLVLEYHELGSLTNHLNSYGKILKNRIKIIFS